MVNKSDQQMNIKLYLKLADSSNRSVQYAWDCLWEQSPVSYMSCNGLQDKERDARAVKMTEIVGSHQFRESWQIFELVDRGHQITLNLMVNQLHIKMEIIHLLGDLEKKKICTKLHIPRSHACKQQHKHYNPLLYISTAFEIWMSLAFWIMGLENVFDPPSYLIKYKEGKHILIKGK